MIVDCEITGITPILMHRFGEEAERQVEAGNTLVMRGKKKSPREAAELLAYRDGEKGLYWPSTNLFAAIIAAGQFIKVGKRQLTTGKSSLVPAGVIINEIELPFGTKNFEVDSRPVVIPSTGGRVMRHRPRIDQWQLKFSLTIDISFLSPDIVRQLLDDAGSKIGIGDYRPARKGPFGRFKVTKWRALDAQD